MNLLRYLHTNFGRLYLEKEQLKNVKTIKLSDNLNWYNKLKFLKCVPEGSCEIPINKIFPFEINMIFEKAWIISLFLILISQMVDVQYFDGRISIVFWILLAGARNIGRKI